MQTRRILFFTVLFVVQSFTGLLAQSQRAHRHLQKADSLYDKNLFVEAFDQYELVLQQEKVYTPAMLLKMSFVQEALGNYTSALYYLNLYYSKHPSRNTLKKMEALAQQHNLKGFEYSDYDFFVTQARKYYMRILELLMMAAVLLVTLSVLALLRRRKPARRVLILQGVLVLFLFYYLNFLSFGRFGIVSNEQLALMSGPSAGSTLLRTLPKGNRLELLDQEDIWYRIRYSDTIGYVRQQHVLTLPQ